MDGLEPFRYIHCKTSYIMHLGYLAGIGKPQTSQDFPRIISGFSLEVSATFGKGQCRRQEPGFSLLAVAKSHQTILVKYFCQKNNSKNICRRKAH